MRFFASTAPVVLTLALGAASPLAPVSAAAAQATQSITNVDIDRLRDAIDDVSRDVTGLRGRNAQLARELETELGNLRDETVYLQVKIRKGETVPRSEYSEMRDRVDALRSRARAETRENNSILPPVGGSGSDRDTPAARSSSRRSSSESAFEVPAGTEFDVRLQDSLSSATAQVEDRFEATTMVDLQESDRLLVPTGSVMRGVVSSVNKAGRIERKGSMTVAFDQITVNGRTYPLRATVTEAIESEGVRGEAGKIGTGAGVGAIIGGILGGFKGALAGILIGGGGTIAATEGKDAELPAGTVLRVRLDAPLNLNTR